MGRGGDGEWDCSNGAAGDGALGVYGGAESEEGVRVGRELGAGPFGLVKLAVMAAQLQLATLAKEQREGDGARGGRN